MAPKPASVEEIASILEGTPVNNGYKVKCPCPDHNDKKASLHINIHGKGDGRPTVHCYAGCQPKDIFQAIEDQTGLCFEKRELAPTPKTNDNAEKYKTLYPSPIDWTETIKFNGRPCSGSWRYVNSDNQLMFAVARFEHQTGKDIRPFSAVESASGQPMWKQKLTLVDRPVYNIQELLFRPNKPVLVVEGEKTADAAIMNPAFSKYAVITFSGGAGNWKKTSFEQLRGRKVFLWPDNDAPGQQAFDDLAKSLNMNQFCEEVQICRYPRGFPEKWDLADELPDGLSYDSVKWEDAPVAGEQHQISAITSYNYMEAFDAKYLLYYDGINYFTIAKQYWVHSRGRVFDFRSSVCKQLINVNHPAYNAAFVGKEPAIRVWAKARSATGDFISAFKFSPAQQRMVIEDTDKKKCVNLYTGMLSKPVSGGDAEFFKEHVFKIICGGNEEDYDWLWNYLAHMVQYPEEKPGVAVVLKGEYGVGKTIFFDVIQNMMGGRDGYVRRVAVIDRVLGRFNSILSGCLMLVVEEMELIKSIKKTNEVKSMITESTVEIEMKGRDTYSDSSYLRLMASTNSSHVWAVSEGERRLTILNASNERKMDLDYFRALADSMRDQRNLNQLFYELSNHQVDRELARTAIQNEAKNEQAALFGEPAKDLAEQLLKMGDVRLFVRDESIDPLSSFVTQPGEWKNGNVLLPTKLTNAVLTQMAESRKYSHISFSKRDKRAIATTVANYLGAKKSPNGDFLRSSVNISWNRNPDLSAAYVIPTLMEARQHFCKTLHLSYDSIFDSDEEISNVLPITQKSTSEMPF